jgi:hypothetical protein
VIGDGGDGFHMAALMEYPSRKAFVEIAMSPDVAKIGAAPQRGARRAVAARDDHDARTSVGELAADRRAPGSPYSRKLRAVLRYRRIPYTWAQMGSSEARALPRPRVELLPQLVFPGRQLRTDRLVAADPAPRDGVQRALGDPRRSALVAFLDALLEDYADEWLTKAMFHYRWAFPADVAQAATILPRWRKIDEPEEAAVAAGKLFSERQIGRLGVVRLERDDRARDRGQLCAPARAARLRGCARRRSCSARVPRRATSVSTASSPSSRAWTPRRASSRSSARRAWWRGSTSSRTSPVSSRATAAGSRATRSRPHCARCSPRSAACTRRSCSRTPTRSRAAPSASSARSTAVRGCRSRSLSGKCLQWLREGYAALPSGDRAAVDAVLAGTGCEALFA